MDSITFESKSAAEKKLNLLLCSSGNVTKERVKCLLASMHVLSRIVDEFHLRVVVTNESRPAFEGDHIKIVEQIYTDEDEWSQWRSRGDPVLHIDLTKWADMLILAPLDLNTMAKIASGICDNLLTCTLRAWNLKKPVIFCPAIHSEVRKHALTELHAKTLQSWGYKELLPPHTTLNPGTIISRRSRAELIHFISLKSVPLHPKQPNHSFM